MEGATTAACPHCGAESGVGAAFCQQCGKALPGAGRAEPRVIAPDAVAFTDAGRQLQCEELRQKARRAAVVLLAVAIIQTLVGVAVLALMYSTTSHDPAVQLQPVLPVVLFGLAAFFYGLWFWARTHPLPAAIVGLVTYVSIIVAGGVNDPSTLLRGWIVKLIIVVAFAKAIQLGLKHRALIDRMTASAA